MTEVHQHWYETARYQEVAAFQWYLQMKWLDMRPKGWYDHIANMALGSRNRYAR